MFDIGWTEILVIATVAIIVVGPRDLPRMMRTVGRYAAKVKAAANDFKSQFDDAIRESELDEIRTSVKSVTDHNPMHSVKQQIEDAVASSKKAAEPGAKSSSTGASATSAAKTAAATGTGASASDARAGTAPQADDTDSEGPPKEMIGDVAAAEAAEEAPAVPEKAGDAGP